MAKVHFGFTPKMEALILSGRKCCTTRINPKRKKDDTYPPREPRCKVDDTFEVQGETFRIISVRTMVVQDVRCSRLEEEGFRAVRDESGKIIQTAIEQMNLAFTDYGYPPEMWGRPCVVYTFGHVCKTG